MNANKQEVHVHRRKKKMTTYLPNPPIGFPMFFENRPYQGASGKVYPIPYTDGLSDTKQEIAYDVYTLENEYLQTEILPQIGGKVLRGYDKIRDYDFIYYNEVIKPALVGLAGPWISGGIEFNWPQHHRPTTFMPLEVAMEDNADGGKTVWVGEVEPMNRMKGMVGITIDPGRSYIKAKVRVYNRTAFPQVFMFWSNLAAPVNANYRTAFPPDCEWVNDHDRRAVLSWPIARGIYHTARPYDFGEGTDLTRYDAVKVPSSYLISQGQSDMDFVSGYDCGKEKGFVTVANHYIAPGKKMWHWGIGDFGDMWCSNLTDENGPYIELMTGVYTDNQPDFTWLAPYEEREFEQFWYPVGEIGEVKNAGVDAAVNLEKQKDGLFLAFQVTGEFPKCKVLLKDNGHILYEEVTDLSPRETYRKTLPMPQCDYYRLALELQAEDGRTLISYTPYRRGQKKPIAVREPVKEPRDYESVEELYLNGLHLEQYKQHNYMPEDYYLEGLQRDAKDTRCNESMARLCLRQGRYQDCIAYCDAALERLLCRNQHPTDTQPFYYKGLALVALGNYQEAYQELYKAAWNYEHRAAALFELACLDCRNTDYPNALSKLQEVLALQGNHFQAQTLQAVILRKQSSSGKTILEDVIKRDPLNLSAWIEYSHYADCCGKIAGFADKPDNLLDTANGYLHAGFQEDAYYVLSFAGETNGSPMIAYYRNYCRQTQDANPEQFDSLCFPSRLEDIPVLLFAAEDPNKRADAMYYLGCLYYDKKRYVEAADCFMETVKLHESHGRAWRNLALYWFDHAKNPQKAQECMEKALQFCPQEPRILFEYEQLLKNRNAALDERLKLYEQKQDLLMKRDDCYLDYLLLHAQMGDYDKALQLAGKRHFHIYEGGEGRLTKLHAWIHVLYALQQLERNQEDKAEVLLKEGTIIPKSYGEAKTFFNQEAHIFYFLGNLFHRQGKFGEAAEAYDKAAEYKAAVSEISIFRALALKKQNRMEEAGQVLQEMKESARQLLEHADRWPYYGVGSPSPMPFEYDVKKRNLIEGHIRMAYALLGSGEEELSISHLNQAGQLDPHEFRIYCYNQIKRFL